MTTLITAVLLLQVPGQATTPQTPSGPTAVQSVQNMLARYAGAKTAAGQISLVQSAAGTSIKIDTTLAFDRNANRLLIQQTRQSSEPFRFLAVSDGSLFSYDKPQSVIGRDRFKEQVSQHGKTQTVGDLYAAARPGLGDANALLDVAIGRQMDLKELMGKWVTMTLHSRPTLDGVTVNAIVGNLSNMPGEPTSGSYEAYITDGGDFVKYVTKQNFAVPAGEPDATGARATQPITVTSIWTSKLTLDQPVDVKLFKVP